MKSSTLLLSTTLGSLLVLCTACGTSGDDGSNGGAGGLGGTSAGGSGGAMASGGTSMTSGGMIGSGGSVTPTGGLTSAGGSLTGGVTASGGANPVTGGITGAGGSTVVGGTTGSGGATLSGGNTSVGGGTTGTGGRGRGGGTGVGGGTGTTGGGTGVGGSTDVTGGTTGAGGTTGDTGGSTGVAGGTGVNVQLAQTKQTIQGFGINTALATGSVPVSTMFSTTGADGIGLSILRVGMNTDGSLTGSGISEAKAAGAKIIGSCWSAPAGCKSNGKTTDGGHLKTPEEDGGTCYDTWSTTIANFASQQGLYAMSIANESDFASCPGNPVCTDSYDTMTYTAKQMVEFVKIAGPKLRAKNIKVIAPECSEWLHLWSTLSATGSIVASHPDSSDPHKCGCFSNTITADAEAKCTQACKDGDGYDYGHWLWKDQEAWKAFDIFGVHEYDSQVAYAWPADVNEGKRDREVWQTEMSGVMHWPEQGPSTDINNGIAVAGWIHSALTVGEASAWLYWWYQALYQDDNEGLAKLKSGGTTAKRYYTLGNYSKFVRPGYLAVDVTGNSDANLLLSAYKSADGAVVVIVGINKGGAAAEVPITIAGGTAPASCTPTVTSANDNLKDGTAVSVAAGVLTASFASKTVTTYTCK